MLLCWDLQPALGSEPLSLVANRRRRPPGSAHIAQYVDDGQLALELALVMIPARCFLQRRPWISMSRRGGAADVPAGPDDAPFLLKVRWLLEALFHPARGAPWHLAQGDASHKTTLNPVAQFEWS